MELVFGAVGLALGFLALFALLFLKSMLFVGKPNEMFIFSGRRYKLPDGSVVGYRVVHGGVAWRIPMLEVVDRMDLGTIPIELTVQNAYSKGGIPLAMHAIANVKVSSHERSRNNAIERFLGRDPSEIKRVAKESLEGHLRGIIARLTPEEVNEDRLKFAEELVREAGDDFDKLGLSLDTLKVQSVSDDVKYLDSIGRERLANVLAAAEIAESSARSEAEQATAQFSRDGQVANEQAENLIRQRENQLRTVVAELEGRAKSEEERAEQAALAARSRAEVRLQELRARLQHLKLTADVVLPAEFERKAQEMRARQEAAAIAADGQAMAEVLRMLAEIWLRAGDDAKDIFLVQQIEKVLATVTDRVGEIEIGQVHLVDGGDGGALPQHIASLPATVSAIFRELRATTGIDVTGVFAGPPPHGGA